MPDLALLDLKLPDGTGSSCCARSSASQPEVPVIMMTAFGELETAVEAMSAGAFWFVKKPFQNDELLALVARALESQKLWLELRRLRHTPFADEDFLHSASPAMQEAYAIAEQVARGDTDQRADRGRERHRQGVLRQPDPPHERAARQAVRRDQLRGDPERAARERAVRPREGRVHRRPRAEAGLMELATAARCSWTRSGR
jgi:DNA-binding response OmpR family regulator